MTNTGTINWTGGNSGMLNGATAYNQAGGVFNIECDNYCYYNYGTETFNNAGLLQKFGTTGQTVWEPNLINTGVVVAQSGTLYFDNYYSQTGNLGGTFLAETGATSSLAGAGF